MLNLLTRICVGFSLLVPVGAFAAPAIELPQTGQQTCWDSSGAVIPCQGTGQDGDTRTGLAWPAPRFTDNGDGTIVDRLTDLLWVKNANCYDAIAWQDALTRAGALASGACGLTDNSTAGQWRVPNRTEMLSIINYEQSDGAIWLNSQGFTNGVQGWYWTSDTFAPVPAAKWVVHSVGDALPTSMAGVTTASALFVRNLPVAATVTATGSVNGGNGTISSTNPVTVAGGTAASFTLAPAAGFEISGTVGGTCPAGAFNGAIYHTGTLTANCTVEFAFIPQSITPSTVADCVKAFRHSVGKAELTAQEIASYDLAPLGADGKPAPDGVVDVGDVVIMLRRLAGLLGW